MEQIVLRVLLLVVMGLFLLLSGVFMDHIGGQVNSSEQDIFGLPINPHILVGRLLISIGVVMLVVAIFLFCRVRFRQKKRGAAYQNTSPSHAPFIESQPETQSQSQPQQSTRQNMSIQLPHSAHIMNYSTTHGAQNVTYSQGAQLSGGRRAVRSPAAAMLLCQYSSTVGAQNVRYSGTSEASERSISSGTAVSQTEALIPTHSVPQGSWTHYPTEEEIYSYPTTTMGQTIQPSGYNRRNRRSGDQPGTNPSGANFDDPPPYDSTDIPPPYYP